MKQELLGYSLQVRGIFGRNRKAKFESFHMTDAEVELPVEQVESLMASKIAEIKVKSGCVRVVKDPVTIEKMGGVAFRVVKMNLFDESNVVIDWKEPRH